MPSKSLPRYKDYTIKARLISSQQTEKYIQALQAEFVGNDFQTDMYFESSKGKLKWRKGDIENLITHYERFSEYGTERTEVYRYDVNPSALMIDELQRNFRSIGVIQKTRKIYLLNNIKIHLDKLSTQEEFIEIEAIDLENQFTPEELRQQCLIIKQRLNIADADLLPTGYFKTP